MSCRSYPSRSLALLAFTLLAACPRGLAAPNSTPRTAPPVFDPAHRAVSTWRVEAADHLVLTADQIADLRGKGMAPRVARCVKLNNYWCIKTAGWDGELASDGEGHVAFASAVEGAAVAALLLKRYYVDFHRKSAMEIVSHWAPAQCGLSPWTVASRPGGGVGRRSQGLKVTAPNGLAGTLRARWLSTHPRGFATPFAGVKSTAKRLKRSIVADHVPRMIQAPTIAVGLGEASKPMTLDALMRASPNAPPSRSMIGMPRGGRAAKMGPLGSLSGCMGDAGRIASYAVKAAVGIKLGPGGDLELFGQDGAPTGNLKIMMTNMARVEIGPLGPTSALIDAGIEAAFRPGRNPAKH